MNLGINSFGSVALEKKKITNLWSSNKSNIDNCNSIILLLTMLQKAGYRHISIAILVILAWPQLWSVVLDEYDL